MHAPPATRPTRPLFLQQRSTDEYVAPPDTPAERRVVAAVTERLTEAGGAVRRPVHELATDRIGTAIGLRALNAEYGAEFFAVPEEATHDRAVADEVFSGPEAVIDVQTHFLAPHASDLYNAALDQLYAQFMPDWWAELEPGVRRDAARYVRNVFLETENVVAVLTSSPGLNPSGRDLFNDEIAATRALIESVGGTGRLLNHAIVHADQQAELEAMEEWRDELRPVGWKVYTHGRSSAFEQQSGDVDASAGGFVGGWQLDDDRHGIPFLERARDLGVPLVCAHKGISNWVDNGSPRDIGPAARMFPDIDFLVYHSGYEFPDSEAANEGPYTEATAHHGINRLITSLRDAGLDQRGARRGNVYAELGSTWFGLVRRPREAAHVLGKLIAELGEDHVLWGTDSIWYGAAQPLVDAFRAFQIPDDMCAEFGYRKLTAEVKAKILGGNAARVYGIDLDAARRRYESDDLAWARRLAADFGERGVPGLR